MTNQTVKAEIMNNILVTMSGYVAQGVLMILEQLMADEFVRINVEEITTLPAEVKSSVDEQNAYIINLFIYKKKALKEKTKKQYLMAVKRLMLETNKPLHMVDDTDVYHYLNQYEKRNVASGGKRNQATTVNNERRFLSAFYTWMRKEKLIAENPVEATEIRKASKKPIDYFKPEEIEQLREGCETLRDRALLEVLRSTGARVGEIIEIDRETIDWSTGDILICGEKGGRYRTIYLDVAARHHLEKYLESRTDVGTAMFTDMRKNMTHIGLGACGIRLILKQIGKRAKLKCRVYPHKLRKTLGMELKNKGVDIGIIQEIMGHADPGVTAAYYAQSTPTTLRNVRERLQNG